MNVRLRRIDSAAKVRPVSLFFAVMMICSLSAVARSDDKAAPKGLPAKTATTKPKSSTAAAAKTSAIPIADIKHPAPVDFQSEVLPVLRRNCIACHNSAKAENHLVLETPQLILKGGESGPAVLPKHPRDSLLLIAAAHLDDPTMPPPDNKVQAVALTPTELGLIKLWIDQGATGQVNTPLAPLHWQKLPPTVRPILAVAVSSDGELAACGRDNEIYVYGIGSGASVARLVDPALAGQSGAGGPGVAHMDLVQSLAFQPTGDLLASGGFREVKLWQRPRNARLGTLRGAAGPIRVVAVSADGDRAATGDASGTIRLWQLPGGKSLQTMSGHTAAITGLAFSADGKTLFSSSLDRSIREWQTGDGSEIGRIDAPVAIDAMVLAHRGAQICAGDTAGVVHVWDVASLKPGQSAKPQPSGNANKQGHAASGAKRDVKPLKELKGHSGAVTALASWGDGTQILSAGLDGTLRGWNLENGRQTRQINHGAAVYAVAVRSDGKRFASCGADNVVRLWDGDNKRKIAELHGDFRKQFVVGRLGRALDIARSHVDEANRSVADAETVSKQEAAELQKAKDGKTAADKELAGKTAAAKQSLDAKAKAEKELAAAIDAAKKAADQLATINSTTAKSSAAKSTAAKPDAPKSAAAKADKVKDTKNKDPTKAAADAKRAVEQAQQAMKQAKRHLEETTRAAEPVQASVRTAAEAVKATANGVAIAERSTRKAADAVLVAKKTVATAEAAQKDASAALEAATKAAADGKPVRCLAFSPNGQFLAIGGDSDLVQTISAENGDPADTFAGAADAVLSLAYTRSAGLLAGGADKSAILWNTEPVWPLLRTIGSVGDPTTFIDRVISLDFSPDGRLLATGGGYPSRSGELKIWNAADGSLVRAVPDSHSDTICAVRFSPSGKLLATGATDRTMKVFDVATGSLMKTFEGHSHHVLGVAWRADGRRLATAGGDNVAKIWDYASGEQRLTIEAFSKEVTAIVYVGTSHRIMTTCGDHYVRMFNTDNGVQDRIYFGANDFLYSLGLTPDGTLVAAGGQDGVLRVWNVENAKIVRSFER